MTELKPCPVCGSKPTTYEIKAGYGEVVCEKCGLIYPNGRGGIDMMVPEDLIRGWNSLKVKRKPPHGA